MPTLPAAWRLLLGLLLPARCVGCGDGGSYFCGACAASAPRLPFERCQVCAQPGPRDPCASCALRRPAFDRVIPAYAYDGAARNAVRRLKYANLRALAPLMAAPMADALAEDGWPPDLLLPVPMHPAQLRRRGFNQAALLAGEIAARTDVERADDAVARKLQGWAQARTASREERWAQVAYAFEPRDGASSSVADRRVAIVDDVLTTGATADAVARALKWAGVSEVAVLVFARRI
ncbi:MAG: ComF family protein [Dehalococcoidia bacterium]|nr:ComF family protein [Dehalococcoidia bacterium]